MQLTVEMVVRPSRKRRNFVRVGGDIQWSSAHCLIMTVSNYHAAAGRGGSILTIIDQRESEGKGRSRAVVE